MRYASVCSGIEAPSVAWHPLGWKPVFFSEIEKFPSRVLAYHYPDVPNLGDMTRIDGAAWRGKLDALIGGTPCQAFSVAGKRESLADDRGNLSLIFCELVHAIDPLCVVWENVPGVLSTKDNAFGCFLAGLVGEQSGPFVSRRGSWPVAGMVVGPQRSACWRILDAQYFGLAQRRRRVFVVSFRTRDDLNPAAVLLEPESLPRRSAPRREAGAGVAEAVTNRIDRGGVNSEGHDGHLVAALHADVSPAINARDGKGPSGDGDGDGDGAILVPMVAHSLRAEGFDASEDGTGRGTPLVAVPFTITGTNKTNRVAFETDLAGSLRTKPPGSQENSSSTVIAFQCHGSNVGPMGHLRAGNGNEAGGVPFVTAYRTSGNCGVMEQGDRTASLGTHTDPNEQIIQGAYGVRRLTPVECERLQGFPDDYTAIPGAKDGPRYKALGNSMAVPVIRWIGERVERVVKAHALLKAGAA